MIHFTKHKTLLTASVALTFLVGTTGQTLADINNTATVTATPPSGGDITASDTETIILESASPEFTVTKTLDSLSVGNGDDGDAPDGGDVVTYQIAVENTGNQTLNSLVVADPGPTFGPANDPATGIINAPVLASGDDGDNLLEVGETWIYSYTYTLTQADVDAGAGDNVYNTADVTALDPNNNTIDEAPGSTLSVTEPLPLDPSVTFSKIATRDGTTEDDGSLTPYQEGETVTYVFEVQNTGNVTLSGITVSEDSFDGVGAMSSITPATATIEPGATATFTATYVIQQGDIDGQ